MIRVGSLTVSHTPFLQDKMQVEVRHTKGGSVCIAVSQVLESEWRSDLKLSLEMVHGCTRRRQIQ